MTVIVNIWCAGGEGHQWAEWTLAAELCRLPVSLFGPAGGGSWTEGSLSFRSYMQHTVGAPWFKMSVNVNNYASERCTDLQKP